MTKANVVIKGNLHSNIKVRLKQKGAGLCSNTQILNYDTGTCVIIEGDVNIQSVEIKNNVVVTGKIISKV